MQLDTPNQGSRDVNPQHSFWNGTTWWSVGGLWWWDGWHWQPFDTYAAGIHDRRRLRKREQRKRLIVSLIAAAAGAVLLVVVLAMAFLALLIGYTHNAG